MRLIFSGKTYEAGLSPLVTDAPKEHGWPEPTSKRMGRGIQVYYDVDRRTAEQIVSHVQVLASGFWYSDSPEVKADMQAMLKDIERNRKIIAANERNLPMQVATVHEVAEALHAKGYRVQVLPADPPMSHVACVNVWKDHSDRYPTTSVWEPYQGTGWTWGSRFEQSVPETATAQEIAETVIVTSLS